MTDRPLCRHYHPIALRLGLWGRLPRHARLQESARAMTPIRRVGRMRTRRALSSGKRPMIGGRHESTDQSGRA
jgi:hypothetical protein